MGAYLTGSGGASFNQDQGGIASAGQDYRQTRNDYGRAMRLLRRESRRDPNAALKMIDLRNNAREQGIQIGGIRRAENEAGNAQGYAASLDRMGADRQKEADVARGMATTAMAPQMGRRADGLISEPMRKQGDDLGLDAPSAAPVLDAPTTPRPSFAEQERMKREQLTKAGAFGTGAQSLMAGRRR